MKVSFNICFAARHANNRTAYKHILAVHLARKKTLLQRQLIDRFLCSGFRSTVIGLKGGRIELKRQFNPDVLCHYNRDFYGIL
jgi:hypothetical protein